MKRFVCVLLAAALLCACAAAESKTEAAGAAATPKASAAATPKASAAATPKASAAATPKASAAATPKASAKPTPKASAAPTPTASAPAAPTPEILDIVGEVQSVRSGYEDVTVRSAQLTPEATAEPSPTPEATPEPTEAPRLAGISIGIDPGHQEHANSDREPIAPGSSEMKQKVLSGTQGVRTGIPEYETNLTISLQLRDALEEMGATVYMTRETNDVDISNRERALLFNEWNVDLALRIHCNGASSSSVHGAGTYARATGEKQAESERAATLILDSLCATTGARRDGVFLRDTYTGQNWATVPCVMVEMGYMSNPEEDEKLNNPTYQKLLVLGIAEGICRYFEIPPAEDELSGAVPEILLEGSRGSAVQALQERLIELGYLDEGVDGIFGPNTAAAVRAFQAAAGMEENGMADPVTQEALFAQEAPEAEAAAEEALAADEPDEAEEPAATQEPAATDEAEAADVAEAADGESDAQDEDVFTAGALDEDEALE